MKKIIINLYGKDTAVKMAPIIVEICQFASYEDAMAVAKFEASKIDKKHINVVITSI